MTAKEEKAVVAEVKRNISVLEEIAKASDLRIAYKTEEGWKRLRVPATAAEVLRLCAAEVIDERLSVLLPVLTTAVTDKALDELVAELNDR